MRILAWNIRWGGAERIDRILSAVAAHQPDIAIISEFKNSALGSSLADGLLRQGLANSISSNPSPGRLGVLIASRAPVAAISVAPAAGIDPWHLLGARTSEIDLLGVYLPWDDRKAPYWSLIHEFARTRQGTDAMIVGDFNTACGPSDGDGEALRFAQSLGDLAGFGYCDVWREANPDAREYTWGRTSLGTQRLDHLWASTALKRRLMNVRYSHDERMLGISDHSILLADVLPSSR